MPRKTLIQIRRGTKSQWDSSNPTLSAGEMIQVGSDKIAIGSDGTTTWQQMDGWLHPWMRVDGGNLDS
jgi:hypothetical protein